MTSETERSLKQIEINTAHKRSYSLILSSNSTDFTTVLDNPIQLGCDNWTAGLINLETYNSIPNITSTNNAFTYSTDSGTSWKTVTLSTGAYEIDSINSEIERLMQTNGDSGIEILANVATLGSVINIAPATHRVDLTVPNSLAATLGFTSTILSTGFNVSPNIVNILTVNSILVHCDIMKDSYLNNMHYPTIYSFFPNVNPGYKIVQNPINIVYLPLHSKDIFKVRIWLTDQDLKPINLRGEKITIRMELKRL